MTRSGRFALWTMAAVAFVVLVVDVATKRWALAELSDRDIDVVWTLRLHLVRNTGGAFSSGTNFAPVFAVLAVGVVIALVVVGRRSPSRFQQVALGLLVGGALGNLSDRVFRQGGGLLGGAVVDFVDLQWWPVFNVADVAISTGVVMLLIASWRPSTPAQSPPP